jgi:hypothetical protein
MLPIAERFILLWQRNRSQSGLAGQGQPVLAVPWQQWRRRACALVRCEAHEMMPCIA